MTTKDPNPQDYRCSAYEALLLTVTMRPPLTVPWPNSTTFQVNVRDQADDVVLRSTSFSMTNQVTGVATFPLTSTQTGQLDPTGGDLITNPSGGDFPYDIWRTDTGNEKRLAWGTISVLPQQWKP